MRRIRAWALRFDDPEDPFYLRVVDRDGYWLTTPNLDDAFVFRRLEYAAAFLKAKPRAHPYWRVVPIFL